MQIKPLVKSVENINNAKAKDKNAVGNKEDMFKNLLLNNAQSSKNEKTSQNKPLKDSTEKLNKSEKNVETREQELEKVKDNGSEDALAEKAPEKEITKDIATLIMQLLQSIAKDVNSQMKPEDKALVNSIKELISAAENINTPQQQIVALADMFKENNSLLSSLKELVNKLEAAPLTSEESLVLEKLWEFIPNSDENAVEANSDNLAQIKSLINKILKEENTEKKVASSTPENVTDLEPIIKEESFSKILTENSTEEQGASETNAHAANKEEKLLNSLVKSNDEGKNNKINMFMQNLTKFNGDVEKIPSAENMVVNKNTFNADVIKAVKYMDVNNLKELTVRLYPKELGQITIKLTMEAGIMKANLATNNKDTYNLLHANIKELNENLNNSQFKVNEVTINIYNEDTTFFKQQGFSDNQNRQNQSGNGSGKNSAIREEETLTLEQLNVNSEQKDKLLNSNVSILA